MKTLKFTTCAPGFMGAINKESLRYQPEINSELQGVPLGKGAYIHGTAEGIACYDKPIFFDGDMDQLDAPLEEQDIEMYLDDKVYKIQATYQDTGNDMDSYYLTLKPGTDGR